MNASVAQPTEPLNQIVTPTFPSAGIPIYQPQTFQPNDPKFYDGSITQVLQPPLPSAGIPMPTPSFPVLATPMSTQPMSGLGLVAQPEVKPEDSVTDTKGI
eukprot:CAMPEP_0205799542 /NCGR_PEP_ID=MMETSP0205-20121125/835_1 /ASSEMBLY_ACC=CAM_ASM_000278 /TAXON_ID=36767 /ORGANISM="Euplotes focardii, Strain TN1" /LENGTH=100 /DNA_ID=CAMNT_0053061003 /DNA_START=444 /DNA_END=746 /DNA_ORIENTATION=+